MGLLEGMKYNNFTIGTRLRCKPEPVGYRAVNVCIHLQCHHHQSVLPQSRSFTGSAGTQADVLPKAGLPPQTKAAVLQGIE